MKLSKELAQELLRILRKYKRIHDIDYYSLAIEKAKEISTALYGHDHRRCWITDFSNSVLNFRPRISNEEFYTALSFVGIDVTEATHDEPMQPVLSE